VDDLFDTVLEAITGWFGTPTNGYRPKAPSDTSNPPKSGSGVRPYSPFGRDPNPVPISAKDTELLSGTPAPLKILVPVRIVHFTIEDLQKIMPRMQLQKGELLLPHLNAALDEFGISGNDRRLAAFIAQVAHETYQLRFTEEEWGPTEAQKNYEPPSHLSTVLGNVEKGDGFRYKGRGAFQCTGRTNYRRYGHALGIDLEGHPELAGEPANTFRIAGVYWNDHKLSDLADSGNFREITRRVNGGYNGEAEREGYWKVAKDVLGIS
jgi:putative chitinase